MSLLKTQVKLLPLVVTGAYFANRYGVHAVILPFLISLKSKHKFLINYSLKTVGAPPFVIYVSHY